MLFLIPVRRRDDVPFRDARIVENTGQPVEQSFLATESAASAFLGFILSNAVGRDGRNQGKKAARLHDEPYSAPAACRFHGLFEVSRMTLRLMPFTAVVALAACGAAPSQSAAPESASGQPFTTTEVATFN